MGNDALRVVIVSGARPNFMKVAPVMKAMRIHPRFDPVLLHTGQHYDDEMSLQFFRDLGLVKPDVDLEVGSLSHAAQTAAVMTRFDIYLDDHPVDLVIVVGDVNSTIACALTAVKRGIRVAHIEAGLRSFDRRMPEEINRILTDAISHFLFITERSAAGNLSNEGVPEERIHFVGNVMVDSLLSNRKRARELEPVTPVPDSPFALVTLHRPSNVDREEDLTRAVHILEKASEKMPLLFPVHPRTEERLRDFGLLPVLEKCEGIRLLRPTGYLAFLRLMTDAALLLTDSGGIQEESTALGIPCVTMRENTERPITVEEGTNVVCGLDRDKILDVVDDVLSGRGKKGRVPEKWDGRAAERIVATLEEHFPAG